MSDPKRQHSPDVLIRSAAESIKQRMAEEKRRTRSLASVINLVDNDEVEMALDHLAHVIEYLRVPILRTEYDQLVSAAEQLDSMDSLIDMGVERYVSEQEQD